MLNIASIIADSTHFILNGNTEENAIRADELLLHGRFTEAEGFYHKSMAIATNIAPTYNNLAWVQQMQGNNIAAITNYTKALQLNPQLRIARRNIAILLVKIGRSNESFYYWHLELATGEKGREWISNLITTALQNEDLDLAGEYARILATLRWGSEWYLSKGQNSFPIPKYPPITALTIPKLRHDIEQFLYLQDKAVLGKEFTPIIQEYEQVIKRLESEGAHAHLPMDEETQKVIGHVYNRIIHIRDTPRIQKALSRTWNPKDVEAQYLDHKPGLVIIDDFLCKEALESIRLFCLESTVWSANRYAHGRFGAFFHDGFNCPLLHQIAEELRESLPRIITKRYPLRQIWGFKNGQYLPPDSTIHADFAAVNVNFWITPEDANMDPTSGGLVVYGVDAPLSWDFYTYNGRLDLIKSFLKEQNAEGINIPYRQNRAIIFNSDLFHNTAGLQFRPEYENRRINITFLYGDRENDQHHHNLSNVTELINHRPHSDSWAWRSPVFSNLHRNKL